MGELGVEAREFVRTSMGAAGYDDALIAEDVPSGVEAAGLSQLPMVAFWGEPRDQFRSAIAVGMSEGEHAEPKTLEVVASDFWAPFAILCDSKSFRLWETLPEGRINGQQSFKLLGGGPFQQLPDMLANRIEQLGPKAVERRKRPWRQMALYEAAPERNAFFEWAYKPTRHRLENALTSILQEALGLVGAHPQLQGECLRWVLRMVGIRLAWDKGWTDHIGDRNSADDLLTGAMGYPTKVTGLPNGFTADLAQDLASIVIHKLALLNLRTADSGVLGQVIQGGGLPLSLQREWKLYPTPPDIAWRVLKSLPIETIKPDQRLIWDGTCGSGTFLAAAVDLLRDLAPPALVGAALRDYLVGSISGNERALPMADATRITLDQALGALAGPDWNITEVDVEKAVASFGNTRPAVITGNPPFLGGGRTDEVSARIIEAYVQALAPGGYLGVIAPRTILSTSAGADGGASVEVSRSAVAEGAHGPSDRHRWT